MIDRHRVRLRTEGKMRAAGAERNTGPRLAWSPGLACVVKCSGCCVSLPLLLWMVQQAAHACVCSSRCGGWQQLPSG